MRKPDSVEGILLAGIFVFSVMLAALLFDLFNKIVG